MTREQKDKIFKLLAEENGKITGADYILQRFRDVLRTEVDPQESEVRNE